MACIRIHLYDTFLDQIFGFDFTFMNLILSLISSISNID